MYLSCRLERRKAEKALEDFCHSKRGEAHTIAQLSMPHAHTLATTSAPATAEGPEDGVEGEGGDGGVPEWLEHSDGRFSPPLLPADAVAGNIVDEDDDREMLLAVRTQVRHLGSCCLDLVPPVFASTLHRSSNVCDTIQARGVNYSFRYV